MRGAATAWHRVRRGRPFRPGRVSANSRTHGVAASACRVGNRRKIPNTGDREIVKADTIQVFPVRGMPEIRPGDALADLLLSALRRMRRRLRAGDVVVVKHKIVSKAEGRMVRLDTGGPSRPPRRRGRNGRQGAARAR